MDPDLIRLILVVLGVLLVAGIYLWDRYKRAAPRSPMVRPVARDDDPADHDDVEAPFEERREPQLGDMSEATVPDISEHEAAPAVEAERFDEPQSAAKLPAADIDPEPADIGTWGVAAVDDDPQYSMNLSFDAHDSGDYLSTDPALADDVERKLIVLHVVAGGGEFRGPAIEKAFLSLHLRLGEMSIYHHHDGASGKVLFSVASMVEPGSFPVDDIDAFATPGLTLFTQLPGARDGIEILEIMLQTAKRLAELLHGELQDERHNKLTGQMERHIAESIIEHRRRLRLARSRR